VFLLLAACASDAHLRKTEEEGERMRLDLAETYVKKGAYTAAIPLLTRELAARPTSDHVHTLYATVLREQGLYPQAEREFRAALAIAPANARAWDGLGVLYDLMRRPTDAEGAHRRALELAPGSAEFWNNLGFSLYVARKTDDAIAALEKALVLDPSLVVAYNNLGFAYGRSGRLEDAERCFRTAGGEAAARLNMAIVHEERGDADEAARLLAPEAARTVQPRRRRGSRARDRRAARRAGTRRRRNKEVS
jgi:Flp pilus assembly protein TadD